MTITAIIQARMTSTRLPGKVMMDLGGKPLLQVMIERVQKSEMIDRIVVAVPDEPDSQPILDLCERIGVAWSKGEKDDVLNRYAKAAKAYNADVVVRLCSDCPLIDPWLIDETIRYFLDGDYDYVNNVELRSYPDGLDCEVFKATALYQADQEAIHPKHREHVTTYIDGRVKDLDEKGDFKCSSVNNDVIYGDLMWSVNTQEQLDHIRALYNALDDRDNYRWTDVLALEKETHDKKAV